MDATLAGFCLHSSTHYSSVTHGKLIKRGQIHCWCTHDHCCTRKKTHVKLAPEQTNEAVACMTGAECLCQGALCRLGLVFSRPLHEKVSVLQEEEETDLKL